MPPPAVRAGRLVSASSNGTEILRCWYDGAGRRVAKREVVGGVTNEVMYVYSGWTVLAVLDASGRVLEFYTRGGGLAGDIGSIVAVTTNMAEDAALYVHGNHRGDVTRARSGTTTLASYDYAAYGEERSASGTFDMRYRFSSKEIDEATGFYYFGFRHYDPHLGRFTTADPIREGGGLNSYAFCGNNPIMFVDPLGDRFKWHGRWGGPGWAAGQWKSEKDLAPEDLVVLPQDARDSAYRQHDTDIWKDGHHSGWDDMKLGLRLLRVPPWQKAFWMTSRGVPLPSIAESIFWFTGIPGWLPERDGASDSEEECSSVSGGQKE